MNEAIIKRFKKAKSRRDTSWFSHFDDCYRYAIPQRETLNVHTPGEKKNTHLYDNTAVIGVKIFANRVQQTVIPSGQQWAKLVAGKNINDEQTIEYEGEAVSLEVALERITDVVFEYIQASNFDTRVNEAILDLAISTGTLTCEFIDNELVFDAVPLSHLYLDAGPKGSIDGVWREHKMEIRNIVETWPKAKLPQDFANKDPHTEVDIAEGMIKDKDDYKLIVFIEESKDTIYEENYGESRPWIPFRWSVVSGEVYGRGPVMDVLPDIKSLNSMGESSLQSAQLSVLGVWTAVDDGVFNPYTFQIAPGIAIPVESNRSDNPTIRALDTNSGNVQFHETEYNRRRDNVNRALFSNPIGSMDDPTKTATEITIRRQIDLQESGASFGRMNKELAGETLKRVVYLLSKNGIIPDIKLNNESVAIKYMSPLAQQKDIEEANILVQSMQMAASTGIPPEVIMGDIKVEDVPSFLLDKLGGPSELKRSETEKKKLQKDAGEIAAAQAGGEDV